MQKKRADWPQVLLDWFDGNKRDLPWRHDRDPYKVWVSEIMLQQTKVETVRPYYDSWMERFPTVQALAAADQETVLRQWQGLGYYSRARNLHAAVQEVAASYAGKVPQERQLMEKLPGVGAYTAGAVLSIAYGQAEAAVDGNVLRVFARLYGVEGNILSTTVKKEITSLVVDVLPADRPGDFNEALMDFGAMVCIPGRPHCEDCPLCPWCQAKAKGQEESIPLRITRKNIPTEEIAVAVISRHGQWLVHRRPETGLLASMWEFPNILSTGDTGRHDLCQYLQDLGLEVQLDDELLGTIKHVFSHKKWHMTVYRANEVHGEILEKEEWQWLPAERYTEIPWAGPHGKITAWL